MDTVSWLCSCQLMKQQYGFHCCPSECRNYSGGDSVALGIVSLFPHLLGSANQSVFYFTSVRSKLILDKNKQIYYISKINNLPTELWAISLRIELIMMMKWCLMSSDVSWHIRDKLWPMTKHGSIIPYVHGKPEGSLGRTAQDGHLDSHTAPELWKRMN